MDFKINILTKKGITNLDMFRSLSLLYNKFQKIIYIYICSFKDSGY